MSISKRIFPYIVTIAALLVSITGSYYSIYGISIIFAGHQTGAIFMGFALEFGNVVTATSLKLYWNHIPPMLRYYLCSAVVILSVITSIGIYGFLSDGYQITNSKDKIVQYRLDIIKKKKERFEIELSDLKKERDILSSSISDLRKSLSTDNQYQTVDKNGNVLTQIQSTVKKGVQSELNSSTSKNDFIYNKINQLNDSISVYDVSIVEVQANNDVAAELGALKYISNLTNTSMDVVVNWFLILLMLVFQPLAIALILTALFAFSHKTEEITEPLVVEEIIPTDPIEEPKKKRKYKPRKPKDTVSVPIEVEGVMDDITTESPIITENLRTVEDIEEPAIVMVSDQPEQPVISTPEPKPQRRNRKRKVVETGLPENLATHLSDSLSIKKKH